MSEIAKGILAGSWTLLIGWILPTALNLGVFIVAVAPSVGKPSSVVHLSPAISASTSVSLLVASVLLGAGLGTLQNPLYRILEGYLLWPNLLYAHSYRRHLRKKHLLQDTISLLRLEHREQQAPLPADARAQLALLRSDPRVVSLAPRDHRRSNVKRALLHEKLSRYPVDDMQVTATHLGNAIRRFEEYGYDRFRFDSQIMWHELTATAPEQARKQVDLARANVDFYVALLAGHALVIGTALAATFSPQANATALAITAAVLACLIPLWYQCAVLATDDWATTVRALVNVGRKPLAESLGLVLPPTLEQERAMWALVGKLSRLPYDERASALDTYRASPPTAG